MQVVGNGRRVAVRLDEVRARDGMRVLVDAPPSVRPIQGLPIATRRHVKLLDDPRLLEDATALVLEPRPADTEQESHVGLLGHERVASRAHVVRLRQALRDGQGLWLHAGTLDGSQKRAHVEPLVLRWSRPAGGSRTRVARGRVVIQEGVVGRVLNAIARQHRGRGSHVPIPPESIAHVVERRVVVGPVDHVGGLALRAELGDFKRAHDVGVARELRVEEEDAQVRVAVEKFRLAQVWHKRRAAREAQATLVIPHSAGGGTGVKQV